MLSLYERIRKSNVTFTGDLSFINDWDFFINEPAEDLESLVSTGPYAGTLEAFNAGVKLRTRYKDLLDNATATGPISFWASDSERVIDTAKYFGAGFFGAGFFGAGFFGAGFFGAGFLGGFFLGAMIAVLRGNY